MSDAQLIDWIDQRIKEKHIKYYEYHDFNNLEEIGSGEFSKVYRANWKQTEKYFALKSFNLDINNVVKKAVNEIKLHREVDFYDHILRFYGITKIKNGSDKRYFLVLEYADGGTLNSYLRKNFFSLGWQDKYRLAFQLSSAIECLHEEGIIHKDLHSDNILIHRDSIKLADFGLSKRIEDNNVEIISSINCIIPYVDPKAFKEMSFEGEELQVKYNLDKKSDIYSVGVLLWQLSSGKRPFIHDKYDSSLGMKIVQGFRESIKDDTPEEYSKLYTKCWDGDPDKRPKIQQVVVSLKEIMSSHTQALEHRIPKDDSEIISIIVTGLITLIIKITNEGKSRDQHRLVLDNSLSLHDATIEEIYEWLNTNKVTNTNHMFFMGYLYFSGIGTKLNVNKAFYHFHQAALQCHPTAQYYLGICYEYGLGTMINKSLAFKWYEKSASHDQNIVGKFALGNCYEKGIGIINDEKMAFNWYIEAANNGHANAQYCIGIYYQQGIYVNRDFKLAFYYYGLSAQGESIFGINMLSYCYLNGIGTSVDKSKAFELYLKAANMKYSIAQYNVAVCYEDGVGTTKDFENAMEWYKKSADNGYELAIKRLDKLSENSLLETKEEYVELDSLTEEQIKQRMMQQWKLHHGLFLDGHSVQSSKQAVFVDDGVLFISLYRGEPMVYININGLDSLTNLLTFDSSIFSDLQPFDICINFPVAEITYKGDLSDSFSAYMEDVETVEDDKDLHDLYGHIFANKFLAGGQLFIKNFHLASSKQIDVLKFYITWAYNSAKNNNTTQFNDDTFDILYLETSNGTKLNTPKKLANWLNNLYQDNVIDIVSYKSLRSLSQLRKAKDAEGTIFAADDSETQDEKNPGIANFERKLSLQEWVGDDLYVNLVKWIKDFHPLQGLVINESHKIENSKKIAINIIEVPKVNISDKTYFEMINPTMKLENNLIFNNIFSMKNLSSFPFIKSNIKSYGDHIHVLFKYEQYEIRLNKDHIKPTKEFEQIIENALNNMKPLEALQGVFDEYGHLFPQRIILGRTLRNILPKISSVNMFDNINLKSPIFELLDNLNISYLLTREGEVVEKNDLINWIQNTSNLEIIELDNIIPFYKILKGEQQRKIDNLLKKSNDRKIIVTGITDLKDLDNDIEDYKRVNFESPLEGDDYEVFGSIISKNNSKLKEFYVNFGLYDFNGFVVTIKKLEETSIIIKECYIIWIVIGNPLKLSTSSNNEGFQVYCIEKSITIQPNKSIYNIKTPLLFLGNNILINSYYPSTNCEPNNIKLIEWKNESINVQIMKPTSNDSSSDDNMDDDSDDIDKDSLTNIDINLHVCILSAYYNNLRIDNYEEKKFPLDLIGYTLTKENLNEKLQDEMDKFDNIQNIIKYPINYMNYGLCSKCNQFNTDYTWCQSCNSKYFKQNFENWTSGNPVIDEFIQKVQLKAKNHREVLEWIDYNKFENVEYLNQDKFGITYKAIWKDGFIRCWDSEKNQWERWQKREIVTLKCLNLQDITAKLLKEIESYLIMNHISNVIHCYGITRDPKTNTFKAVIEFAKNGNLKEYLKNNYHLLDLIEKLIILQNIIMGLNDIHKNGLIHCDLNSSNILLGDNNFAFIDNFGLFELYQSNDHKAIEVSPYIAPEIFERKEYTQASDIYSFGTIVYEIYTGSLPYFNINQKNDIFTKHFNHKIPQSILNIIKQCWNIDPLKRPKVVELFKLFDKLLNKTFQVNLIMSFPKKKIKLQEINRKHNVDLDMNSFMLSKSLPFSIKKTSPMSRNFSSNSVIEKGIDVLDIVSGTKKVETLNSLNANRKHNVVLDESSFMLSRSLPSPIKRTSPTKWTSPISRSFSSNSVIEKGTDVLDIFSGTRKAVTLESLKAYENKIKVLSEVIKLTLGSNKKMENFLETEVSTEDLLKAFQKPSYKEITDEIIRLEKLGSKMREQVEKLRRLNIEEKEDRKKLEEEMDHLKKLNQEREKIVKNLDNKIRMLEEIVEVDNNIISKLEENNRELKEIVGVDNDIISELKENNRELQKKSKLKESEINSLNRCLESKIYDKESLTKLTEDLKIIILDSIDTCAFFYKEKMLLWLENNLKNDGNNLRNKLNCLKQLLELNKETKTGQKWQVLFNSFNSYEENLKNLSGKGWQIKNKLKELEKQDESLERNTQLTLDLESLQRQIKDLGEEREILQCQVKDLSEKRELLSSVNLNEITKKLEQLEKELVNRIEESKSIKEKLSKNENELKEVASMKIKLSDEYQEIRNRKIESGWNRSISSPILKKDKIESGISIQITNNNLKGKQLQRDKDDLEKKLLNTSWENEHFLENFRTLKTQVEILSRENQLYSKLYSLEKPLNSAKAKVRERNLYGLLNVYKSDSSKSAKKELIKELNDEELDAILDEDIRRRKIEEILKELKELKELLINFE